LDDWPVHANPIPAHAGIGLRARHHQEMLTGRPPVAWLEVHTENYLAGAPLACLEDLRRDYPISCHGVGLSLGSADGLDDHHPARIATLVARIEPALLSDHLSWSTIDGVYLGELLPLPLTEEALEIVCRNVDQAQQTLHRTLLLENPAGYGAFSSSTLPEWEFLSEVARSTGCGLLFDVNNIWVSACNLGFDPLAYLAGLPGSRVGEIHLAGHAERTLPDGRVVRSDDHGSAMRPEVWELYAEAIRRFGPKPTLIEWDTDVPELAVLLAEAGRAQGIADAVTTAVRTHVAA
jgi:uncharacterized protein